MRRLALPAFLALLLAAVGAARAQAPTWETGDHHDEEADSGFTTGQLNAAHSGIYTGMAFQRVASNCDNILMNLVDGSESIFEVYYYDDDTRTDGPYTVNIAARLNGDFHYRIFFRNGYRYTDATLQVSMTMAPRCSLPTLPEAQTLAWAVTVVDAWGSLSDHSDEAADVSPVVVRESAARTDTGLAFHSSPSCTEVDVTLLNEPDSVELRRYDGDNESLSGGLLRGIRMQDGHADDNHVRLMVKAGATLTAGSTLTVTVRGSPNAVCSGGGNRELEWKLTVGTPAAWTDGSDHDEVADDDLSASDLNAATEATWTGLAFQRNAPGGCAIYEVNLDSSSQSIFALASYTGTNRNTQLVTLVLGNPSSHARIYLRAGYTHAEATLMVSMAVKGSCLDGTRQENLTLAWPVTVHGPTSWRSRANDRTAASGRFSSYALMDSSEPTATGIQIHRSADDCTTADVALAADTPPYLGLDLHGDGSGVALAASHTGVAMPGSGGTDRHLRLYLRAGAEAPAGVLAVTAMLDADCADPLQLVYQLTVFIPDDHPWVALNHDRQTPRAASFRQSEIRDGQLATGVQLHRSSAECRRADVELLSATDYLEIAKYNAAGRIDGAADEEFEEVLMDPLAGEPDRHVRLSFKAGALPPPAITATVRLTPSASCTSRRNPDPETFSYALTIVADIDSPPRISVAPTTPVTIAADASTTGVTVSATDDDDSDVTIELAAAARRLFVLARLDSGSYELRPGTALTRGARYTVEFIATDDVGSRAQSRGRATVEIADGAPVIGLSAAAAAIDPNKGAAVPTGLRITARDDDAANVRVVLDAASRRNFQLRAEAGGHELWTRDGVELQKRERFTVTFTAIDAEGPGAERSSTATAVVMVRFGSAVATDNAAVDAGAAAARAIGVSGIDAVLARPAAGEGLAPGAGTAFLEMLAAKREELESGEIDLREFLEGQAVALPLSQMGGGGANVGIWLAGGRSDVGGVAGEGEDAVYVDGEVSSTSFGVDARFGQVVTGLSYGLHSTTAEYGFEEEREEAASEYELELQALQPYASFDIGAGRLALALAAGSGELVLRPADEDERAALDVDYVGYALGVAQRVAVFGAGELRLRGSYAAGEFDVDQPAAGVAADLDSAGSVLRLALGYGHVVSIGRAASFSPFLETGYLNMWGDGAVGGSFLVAGGLEFTGGPVTGSASYQQALSDDVVMDGFDLFFRLGRQFGGLGLGFEADPGYGLAGADELLAELGAGRPLALADEAEAGLRGGAGLSYGLAVDGGLLTPYGRWSAGAGRELGLRLRAGARRSWALGYGAAADEFKIEYRLGD